MPASLPLTGAASKEKSNADSRVLSRRSEIADALKVFRDQRSELTLRFDGVPESFTARILDIVDREFLLEDVSPRDGIKHLRADKPFSLSGRAPGLFAFFNKTKVTKENEERGIPYFHVPLPKELLVQRRRKAVRFRLPLSIIGNDAEITLFRPDPVMGRILDISAGGCRAEFPRTVLPPFRTDEPDSTCAITIPRLLELNSKSVIRHLSYNRKNQTWVCGIELTEMHVTDRRRLEQFIQKLARSVEST
jgi:c-di-GMP-binding flagellar brake protein YcgR